MKNATVFLGRVFNFLVLMSFLLLVASCSPVVEQDVEAFELELDIEANSLVKLTEDGLVSINLDTGTKNNLIPHSDGNIGLTQVAISSDQSRLAYWSGSSRLMIYSLDTSIPDKEILIPNTANETKDKSVNLWWVSNSYLILELGDFDTTINRFAPIRAYIINAESAEIEGQEIGLNFGCVLSDENQAISIWCPVFNSSEVESYRVFDVEDNRIRSSTNSPKRKLQVLNLPQDNWIWSQDHEYVSFINYDSSAERNKLNVYDLINDTHLQIIDSGSDYMQIMDWHAIAPTKDFVAYKGRCSEGSCYRILSLTQENVVWTTDNLPELSDETFGSMSWSIDGQLIALSSDSKIFIVDFLNNKILMEFEGKRGKLLLWHS